VKNIQQLCTRFYLYIYLGIYLHVHTTPQIYIYIYFLISEKAGTCMSSMYGLATWLVLDCCFSFVPSSRKISRGGGYLNVSFYAYLFVRYITYYRAVFLFILVINITCFTLYLFVFLTINGLKNINLKRFGNWDNLICNTNSFYSDFSSK
jgi:hypothetical protein